MWYFGHFWGYANFKVPFRNFFKGFAQSIHTPKETYLQILSEIGEIHLHTYFGILRHAANAITFIANSEIPTFSPSVTITGEILGVFGAPLTQSPGAQTQELSLSSRQIPWKGISIVLCKIRTRLMLFQVVSQDRVTCTSFALFLRMRYFGTETRRYESAWVRWSPPEHPEGRCTSYRLLPHPNI